MSKGKLSSAALIMIIFTLSTLCSAETNRYVQSVDENGDGNCPDLYTSNKVSIEGIILNDSSYMLDATPNQDALHGPGAMWQIYIQGQGDDHAGTAVWMGQCYDNLLGGSGTYTNQQWLAELYRLNHDPNSGYEFAPGDKVRVTGLLKFHNGKTNITERHDTDPDNDITIELLEPAAGLPEPEIITLNDVIDDSNNFIFDPNRNYGCEYYQAMRVRINDVTIVDSNLWAPNAEMQITDGQKTFPLKLGIGEGFSRYNCPAGQIDVIGIFDQEGSSTGDYRIWVMNYDGNGKVLTDRRPKPLNIAGDVNNDGIVNFKDLAQTAADWLRCAPGSGGCN